MNKMRKEDALKNYLGEDRIQNLANLYNIVEKSKSIIDDKAYNDMFNILIKYSLDEPKYFYTYFILSDALRKYYDLSYNIISKISNQNNEEIFQMYEFINLYTRKNLDFKISIINEFVKMGIYEEKSLSEFTTFNLYKKLLQIFSIKYKKGYTRDSKELYEQSKLSIIQQKAKVITNSIIKHNNDSYLINQNHFVKPTNSVLEIMCSLPDIIVDNEEDFKKLIDYLYKLFWESNSRGYAKNNELDFINNIRRYYYHDLEHGKDSDVKKKFKLVKDFFKESTGKSIPTTAKEWQSIQEHIYDLLIEFLKNIEIKEPVLV